MTDYKNSLCVDSTKIDAANEGSTITSLKTFYEIFGQEVAAEQTADDAPENNRASSKRKSENGTKRKQKKNNKTRKTEPSTFMEKRSGANRDRERHQRVLRDLFRKKVVAVADRWMRHLNLSSSVKQDIVVNEETKRPCREDFGDDLDESDDLFKKQNGYFYYNILCTPEIERLVSRTVDMEDSDYKKADDERLVMKQVYAADIYLRVMFNADIRPSVFIKFDDMGYPFLFARQTKRMPDTCLTGPPGQYWTKTLHLDSPVKTSQHVALQRVRSGRLIQDSTFVMLGEGSLENIPDNFMSSTLRYRKFFKELYKYIASIPEIDLTTLGWETINRNGVLDPIKTFLPRVFGTEDRSADDPVFLNYVDMFVSMLTHRLNMEQRPMDGAKIIKTYRTEYKFEMAGRSDHPGVYYYRNSKDYITDLCMVNGADLMLNEEERSDRIRSAYSDDDGVIFYDVKQVNDVEMKLASINHASVAAGNEDFYRYVLSECDDVKEMIVYSSNTIEHRLIDAVAGGLYVNLHETDPVRQNPNSYNDTQLAEIDIKTNLSDYRTTYYISKSTKVLRVINEPPRGLESSDCVLRAYRLKWVGHQNGKRCYTIYPYFAVVFKHVSIYEISNRRDLSWMTNEDFTFPEMSVNKELQTKKETPTYILISNSDGTVQRVECVLLGGNFFSQSQDQVTFSIQDQSVSQVPPEPVTLFAKNEDSNVSMEGFSLPVL